MDDKPQLGAEAIAMIIDDRLSMAASGKATLIVDYAIISLLVDAGIVTTEQAAQRIEQIRDALPDGPYRDRAIQQVRPIISLLRQRTENSGPRWTPVVHDGGGQKPQD